MKSTKRVAPVWAKRLLITISIIIIIASSIGIIITSNKTNSVEIKQQTEEVSKEKPQATPEKSEEKEEAKTSKEEKTQTVSSSKPKQTPIQAPTATPTPQESEKSSTSLGNFKITAYCHCSKCCGKSDGITATGTQATPNRTIAVDPRVIPLGSQVIIDGQVYVAEDTGSSIRGNRLDIYFSSHQEAINWGIKYKDVSIIL